MSTSLRCCATALVLLTMLCPSAAVAAPPANVKVTESGGMITATWDNPSYDGSNVPSAVEIAHNPTTGSGGSFADSTKITAPLNPGDVAYTSPALPNGTYFIHVGAYQLGNPSCDVDPDTGELACPTDYSPIWTVKIGPGPPSISGPPGIGDTLTRFKNLRVALTQKATRLLVLATMDEPGTVGVGGSVKVPGVARAFKVKPISAKAATGKPVTVKVKLSKQALAAVAKALKRHRKVKASLTITARDAAGNKKAERRSVWLK